MKTELKELSRPMKVIVTVDAEEVKKLKSETFNKIQKDLPQVKGFRKGNVPMGVAEQNFKLEMLYKPLFDDLFNKIKGENKIVSGSDVKIFGDLKTPTNIIMEFVAEVEPTVELVEFENVDIKYENDIDVTDEEIQSEIDYDLKQKQKNVEVEKENLENMDIALIDYEGVIIGETKPFAGGTAKGYRLQINVENKTFVDNFEEQMLGMVKGETRKISVKFPEEYRNKDVAGSYANFIVTLQAIENKVLPEIEDFYKEKGYDNIEAYKESIKETLLIRKQRNNDDNFKKKIIFELMDKSKISPLPTIIIDQELERQWFAFLGRIGKTEEEALKESPKMKDNFLAKTEQYAKDTLLVSMILKAIQEKYNIVATKEEIIKYTMNIGSILNYDSDKKKSVLEKLEQNPVQYELQKNATLNEKSINFMVGYFKNASK